MNKKECKKDSDIRGMIPLGITGLLAGAIIGGSSQIIVISLAMILYSLGAFNMIKNINVCRFIVWVFLAGYSIFLYQTIQLLITGSNTIPELWYLLDGLIGLFAYMTASRLQNN